MADHTPAPAAPAPSDGAIDEAAAVRRILIRAGDPVSGRRLATLPEAPGVYLFRDAAGRIAYVGKASSLRRRVSSYFQAPARLSPRIAKLVEQVREVEARTTASEAEALLLESRLIKEHQPKYNVAYRDDKSYPCLTLTDERFPRLLVTRQRTVPGKGRGQVFGPYADAALLRQALQFLQRVFPLRTCRTFPKTPCLEYHLGQCLAPCVGYIEEAAYNRIVADLAAFLRGRREDLLRELSRRMAQAARAQRFEEAARLRDQIQALTSVITAKAKSAYAGPLEQLQSALKLPTLPQRIEAFDISNIYGAFAVGSMVCFVGGRPFKAHYRRFKIEQVTGIDDYGMMREVIRRRYSGSLAEQLPWPDLVLVDGGKGHLNAALGQLRALGRSVAMLGLAKREERILLPDRKDPIVLLPTSPVLHLVQHIRDEAHRFAITYHRRLRAAPTRESALDQVPGIGPKRKALLLSRFGTIKALAAAQAVDVAKAAKISLKQAQALLERL
ncbi:MAG: excinuclease ABC subunit UvrC [Candidatus Omnitrophica bacterium]|nr:excinuclease ABC subunit UvrC [Candidatus Omnitrophota bacterium]